MGRSAKIVVSISVSVAVISVAVLVLVLTGVFPASDMWRNAADMSPEEVYKYLSSVGEFESEDPDIEVYESGGYTNERYTFYVKISDSIFYGIDKSEFIFVTLSSGESSSSNKICYYLFTAVQDSEATSAYVDQLDMNETPEEMNTYETFLDWCDEMGLTPEQIMGALDYYQAKVEYRR